MKKADIIYACASTLNEYIDRIHQCSTTTCLLCLLVDGECPNCIMHVFKLPGWHFNGCMSRKCTPVSNKKVRGYDPKVLRVIVFYKRMLAWLRSLSEEEINNPEVLEYLKEIDLQVSKEFAEVVEKYDAHKRR